MKTGETPGRGDGISLHSMAPQISALCLRTWLPSRTILEVSRPLRKSAQLSPFPALGLCSCCLLPEGTNADPGSPPR